MFKRSVERFRGQLLLTRHVVNLSLIVKFEMVRHNQITQVLDEIAFLLARLKEGPSTPAVSKRITDICERRTKVLAKLGWLPFTPMTAATEEKRSAKPFSNKVQETSWMENYTNEQSRRWRKQKVEAEDAQFESVPCMTADTEPLQRRNKRQRTKAEDMQLQFFHQKNDSVV